MRTVTFETTHHLGKLHGEILAAIPSLRPVDGVAVMTVSGNGTTLTLGLPDDFNDSLLTPVLAAHNPTPPPAPIIYSGTVQLNARLRTTNATPVELFRAPLASLTAYTALLELVGVDAGNGALRMIRASIVAKRLSNGAALVGAPVVIANHQDAAASTWAIAATADGNDFVVTVAGAAGRNVDWLLGGTVKSFTPGGQP